MKKYVKKLRSILGGNQSTLSELMKKSAHLKRVDDTVQRHLPENFKGHCYVANLNRATLTLACDSSQMLSLLRFHIPELLTTLRSPEKFPGIANIKCRVICKEPTTRIRPKNKATLSKKAASEFQTLADGIEDERIKNILEKLAKRGTKS